MVVIAVSKLGFTVDARITRERFVLAPDIVQLMLIGVELGADGQQLGVGMGCGAHSCCAAIRTRIALPRQKCSREGSYCLI
ncbi:MAG: hypothetical protein HIU92_20255 [Proteobacteria bacterium]|nr:hypothetical protein [Pseudomonadota bacterium]